MHPTATNINNADYVLESLRYNLNLMKYTGFYPPKTGRILRYLYAFYAKIYFYLFLGLMLSAFGVLNIYMDEDLTIYNAANAVVILMESSTYCFKYYKVLFYTEDVQKSIFRLTDPVFTESTENRPECQKIFEDGTKNCKKLVIICTIAYVSAGGSFCLVPLILQSHELPMVIWLPFNIDISHGQNFFWAYIYITTGMVHVACVSGAIDTLMANLLLHIITQIKILKYNVRTLSEYADETLKSKSDDFMITKDEFVYRQLKKYVNHHNAIKEYVELFSNVYSEPLFIQMSMSACVIGVCSLKLIALDEPGSFDQVFSVIYIYAVSVQIFLYCFVGDLLSSESNGITTAIYMSRWYEYDTKSRKALVMMMMGGQQPLVLKAGKILEVSLNTFSAVIRMASSIVTLITSLIN